MSLNGSFLSFDTTQLIRLAPERKDVPGYPIVAELDQERDGAVRSRVAASLPPALRATARDEGPEATQNPTVVCGALSSLGL